MSRKVILTLAITSSCAALTAMVYAFILWKYNEPITAKNVLACVVFMVCAVVFWVRFAKTPKKEDPDWWQ